MLDSEKPGGDANISTNGTKVLLDSTNAVNLAHQTVTDVSGELGLAANCKLVEQPKQAEAVVAGNVNLVTQTNNLILE